MESSQENNLFNCYVLRQGPGISGNTAETVTVTQYLSPFYENERPGLTGPACPGVL